MKQLLKENFVLVVGVALPFLVALSFFAATKISKIGIEAPQTPFLYVAGTIYSPYYQLTLEVRDERLYMRYVPPQKEGGRKLPYEGYRPTLPQLRFYDPVSKVERDYALPILGVEEGFEGIVPDTAHLRLSPFKESPDGYVLVEDRSRNAGGLLPEIFLGSQRRGSGYVLQKGGYKEALETRAPLNRVQFIGWITDEVDVAESSDEDAPFAPDAQADADEGEDQ